jgi:ribosome modulation factor
MKTALQHRASNIAAARKASTLVQLRTEYACEYRAGMDAHDRGQTLEDCPCESESHESAAWFAGWREAQRQEGD